MARKVSRMQFLVTVSGIDGTWMTKTGGNGSSAASKIYDGGNTVPDVITAPPTYENITVTRGYDLDRDNELLVNMNRQIGKFKATISVAPMNADMVVTGTPTVYPDATLVGVMPPEPDAGSGDAATIGLEFAVSSVR